MEQLVRIISRVVSRANSPRGRALLPDRAVAFTYRKRKPISANRAWTAGGFKMWTKKVKHRGKRTFTRGWLLVEIPWNTTWWMMEADWHGMCYRFCLHQISLWNLCFEILGQRLPNSGIDDGALWPNLPTYFLVVWSACANNKFESVQVQASKESDLNTRKDCESIFQRVLPTRI